MLIAIEGTDGAGKATQSKMLVDRLTRSGHEAVLFSFPRYETPLGGLIRRMLQQPSVYPVNGVDDGPITLQCLMHADKYDAAADIATHIRAGRIVVCDRWKASALAYGVADGLSFSWLLRTQAGLPNADINIFLAVSEREALRRRPKLQDRFEKDRRKQVVVSEQYQALWASNATVGPWARVDGESSAATLEEQVSEVHGRIWIEVEKAYRFTYRKAL